MILEGELKIRLEMTGQGFEITSEDIANAPYHLLAGSLAHSAAQLVCLPVLARTVEWRTTDLRWR